MEAGCHARSSVHPREVGRRALFLLLGALPKGVCCDSQRPTIRMCCTNSCSLTTEPPGGLACGASSAEYDLILGWLSAKVYVGDGGSSVLAQDDFIVTGPSGTPLTFKATLEVSINVCGIPMAGASAGLGEGSNGDSISVTTPCRYVHDLLEITLSHSAGEPFRLTLGASTWSIEGGNASVSGILRFSDLPPEAGVSSCQGFLQAPTPVRAGSWGQLKSRYR